MDKPSGRGPRRIRRSRWAVRLAAGAVLVAGFNVVTIAHPAWACGCGGVITNQGQNLTVSQESSAVVWDGSSETIAMRLSIEGDATDAAWVLPVPTTADVTLGKPGVFDDITEQEEPRVVIRRHLFPGSWQDSGSSSGGHTASAPAAGAPSAAPPVTVLSDEQLGPFEVARLAATDPGALSSWLSGHGYRLPAAMAGALTPYVQENWQYVAVRLTPSGAATLDGVLSPLVVRFAGTSLVYPMRLSVLATTEQHLRLAVFAPHRVAPQQVNDAAGAMVQTFGDWVQPGPLADEPDLAALLGGKRYYLTDFSQDIAAPSAITTDDSFVTAADDAPDVSVVYLDELLRWWGIPAYLVIIVGAVLLLLLLGFTAVLAAGRRRRRRARYAGMPQPPYPPRR